MGQRTIPDLMGDRGGFFWGLQNLRKDIFVQLIKDLDRREKMGLTDPQCDEVKNAIRDLETEATEVVTSDGVLSKWFDENYYLVIRKFRDAYIKWNSDNHIMDDAEKAYHRMKCTDELRDIRHKMKVTEQRVIKKIRVDAYTLGEELDIKRVDAMHQCFVKLCDALPDIFVNLSKALVRYSTRVVE